MPWFTYHYSWSERKFMVIDSVGIIKSIHKSQLRPTGEHEGDVPSKILDNAKGMTLLK
jgi:peroxiredoxin